MSYSVGSFKIRWEDFSDLVPMAQPDLTIAPDLDTAIYSKEIQKVVLASIKIDSNGNLGGHFAGDSFSKMVGSGDVTNNYLKFNSGTSATTASIKKYSGVNGAFDIINYGGGNFNLYNNNIKALGIDPLGGITTHGALALGWNNQSTAEHIELSFRAEANGNTNSWIKRYSGANGNLVMENFGTGYMHLSSRAKLYLESDTGMVYRSGAASHMFENGYIKHASHPNWTAVSFQNSWGNYGGNFQVCQYYKDAMGFVHIRGLAHKVGTHTHHTAINLPVGFRPAAEEIFAVDAAGGHRRIDIRPNGDFIISGGDGDYVSISGITFYAG